VRHRGDLGAQLLRERDQRRHPALVDGVDPEQHGDHEHAHRRQHGVGGEHRDHRDQHHHHDPERHR
jgi:hypothetical protein